MPFFFFFFFFFLSWCSRSAISLGLCFVCSFVCHPLRQAISIVHNVWLAVWSLMMTIGVTDAMLRVYSVVRGRRDFFLCFGVSSGGFGNVDGRGGGSVLVWRLKGEIREGGSCLMITLDGCI